MLIVQGRRDSNPQPPVLETGALPVELLPSGRAFKPATPLSTEHAGRHHDSTSSSRYYMAGVRPRQRHQSGGCSAGRQDRSRVGQAPSVEHRPDHPAVGRAADDGEHVGHHTRRWLDIGRPQLVEQAHEPAVTSDLRLAEQAALDVRHEWRGSRQAIVQDARQKIGRASCRERVFSSV